MTETGQQPYTSRGDWWARRPRRSRSDSKIAGVAGGLARYLGVDPILFRVGFVALTILGGVGVLAYCLLWLLLPADGDEVSAGESLIGRGRSSVSPVLAVALAIVVAISITSSFSWGMPFWPAAVLALIALHIARKRRRGPFRPGSDWEQRLRSTQEAFTSNQWPDSSGQTGQHQWQGRGWPGPGGWNGPGGWGGWGCGPRGRSSEESSHSASAPSSSTGFAAQEDAPSPFDTPAFWDGPTAGGQSASGSAPSGFTPTAGGSTGPVSFVKASPDAPPAAGSPSPGTQPTDLGTSPDAAYPPPRTTPPAWDPLGAAPFAWDLPDIELAPQQSQTLVKSRTASPVIARATMGTAVLAVAVQIFGMIAGWWAMSWAAIGGIALAIVAIGLLVQAFRGKSITLVGPGVLLSVATVALALTGLAGTASVGDINWAPTTAEDVKSSYHLSAGDAYLDLSGLKLTADRTVKTALEVNAGQATVIVPDGVKLNVTCSGNVGNVDCLGNTNDGIRVKAAYQDTNPEYVGTLDIDVHVGTGNVRVTR
jgi:phage shock protein PspC (stress-responsive transcriptional regulator)